MSGAKGFKLIPIRPAIADGLLSRIGTLQGILRCVGRSVDDDDQEGEDIRLSVEHVSDELERICEDLNLCEWTDVEATDGAALKVVQP